MRFFRSYEEDTVEKHKITKEEIQFLKDLQHEMNTQEQFGRKELHYWVVRDYEKIIVNSAENVDGICIFDRKNCEKIYESEYSRGMEKIKDEIIEVLKKKGYGLIEEDEEIIKKQSDEWYLEEILEDLGCAPLEVYGYIKTPKEMGYFLTKKAAEEHLKENGWRYTEDVNIKGRTSWGNSEEPLWNILKTVDFDLLNQEC